MSNYNVKEIEEKWQKKWIQNPYFHAVDFDSRPKFYVLYEFYGISGNLHMGHLKGSVPADALARYKRLKGFNVLFPIGGDAFGLPAENAAIKRGINPEDFVRDGMKNVINQSQKLGLMFDYDRVICTSDPNYYHWTQWIFAQLYKNGKAYKKNGYVNFCKNCKTVLSNEDSQGGICDRCGNPVVQERRDVWFLKMKEYSEKMLQNIDHIEMAENLKTAQRNWIGKSEGVKLRLDLINEQGEKVSDLEIFTTCIETVYGITFVVLAPENQKIDSLKSYISNYDQIIEYRKQTALKSEFERMSQDKDRSGCEVCGIYAINPMTRQKVKVFLADFVLNNYGTGAVMAVPCHDQRDFEFAKAFDIHFKQVISGDCSQKALDKEEYLTGDYTLINSEQFSGMDVKKAKEELTKLVCDMGIGERVVNYKMQDWSFNRQRYWGEPFPIVFCDNCGIVVLDDGELPLVLPHTEDYKPNEKGDSPLSKIQSFVNCKCPKCGKDARRETDTMPNWAGSSWYWLRFIDPRNKEKLADIDKLKYWGGVDVYTGGTEHITRHVLYAFFWQNFLYEIGVVPTRDPFIRKMGSGLVLDNEGKKMSKSSTNGVSPAEVVEKYGADVARMHLHFLSAYEDNSMWTYKGVEGIINFLDKVWDLPNIINGEEVSQEHQVELNKLVKKISYDYENLKLNTAIASLMTFMKKIKNDGFITKQELRAFMICLNPIAPHISSEVYERVFDSDLTNDKFPDFDENKCIEQEIEIPIQVNGKLRGKMKVNISTTKQELEELALNQVKAYLNNGTYKKIIYIPNKIFNIVV